MASYADVFAACFTTAMPGTVILSWQVESTPLSATVQFFTDEALDDAGFTQVQRRAYRVQGLTSAIGTLRRGDSVTVASNSFLCVSNALDDGFGVSELYLEAAPAT